MAGTVSGGKAAAETNKKKYDKYYLENFGMTFYEYQGHLGGKAKKTKPSGFAWMKQNGHLDKLREASARGGRISRRESKKHIELQG
jgi:hypothetical protein